MLFYIFEFMNRLRFSGHESFIARSFWAKKGYEFINNGGSFTSESAVVELGVGKNMVSSIYYWLKSLDLFNEDDKQLTEVAHFIFNSKGADPFLEDIGSIWLLHYLLVKHNYASIFNLAFNKLRKERSSFTKDQFQAFIKRQFKEVGNNGYNPSTIEKDISMFLRTYNTPDYKTIKKNFEDEVSGLFIELELMTSKRDLNLEGKKVDWYELEGKERYSLPPHILLYAIMDNFEDAQNIAFRRLEIEENSPGMIFALNKEGLIKKLQEIEKNIEGVVLTQSAGNIVLVIPENLDKWEILKSYYAD